MSEIPMIQAYVSLQDALLYIKNGMHLARNHAQAKKRISNAIGISPRASYESYAYFLAAVLVDSGQLDIVKNLIKRMDMQVDINKQLIKKKK